VKQNTSTSSSTSLREHVSAEQGIQHRPESETKRQHWQMINANALGATPYMCRQCLAVLQASILLWSTWSDLEHTLVLSAASLCQTAYACAQITALSVIPLHRLISFPLCRPRCRLARCAAIWAAVATNDRNLYPRQLLCTYLGKPQSVLCRQVARVAGTWCAFALKLLYEYWSIRGSPVTSATSW
jgi:hypothetical protein